MEAHKIYLVGGWYSSELLTRSAADEIVSLQDHWALLKAMECSVAKVTFWRLDLVDNAAPTGDGGGVCVVVYGKYFFVAGCLCNCHDNLRLILKSSVC